MGSWTAGVSLGRQVDKLHCATLSQNTTPSGPSGRRLARKQEIKRHTSGGGDGVLPGQVVLWLVSDDHWPLACRDKVQYIRSWESIRQAGNATGELQA